MGIDLELLGGGSKWLLLIMIWGSRLGVPGEGQGSFIGGGMISPRFCLPLVGPLFDGEVNAPK